MGEQTRTNRKPNIPKAAISSKEQLMAADEVRDIATCGRSLMRLEDTRFASAGAHDPTPTPYFVLEALFAHFDLTPDSHVLDVGCGIGRALAYFAEASLPGRMTGVELDPALAEFAASWTKGKKNLQVICGDVLSISLAPYSHFYLFNPFDTAVLLKFLAMVEAETTRPIMLAHMSDNGETYFYAGRTGWSLIDEGAFQKYPPNGSASKATMPKAPAVQPPNARIIQGVRPPAALLRLAVRTLIRTPHPPAFSSAIWRRAALLSSSQAPVSPFRRRHRDVPQPQNALRISHRLASPQTFLGL